MKILPLIGLCIATSAQAQDLKFLPPEEFDRPYTAGKLVIQRAPTQAILKAMCPDFRFDWGPALGCSYMQGTTCRIIMAADDVIRAAGYDPDIVKRHEVGHCNGWVGHKGAR